MLENNLDYFENIYVSLQNVNSINNVELCKCGYDINRLKLQQYIIDNIISTNNHNVLGASAGFGKTLTGLLWFLKENKKLIWVVPRNVIADGTYDSIIKELEKIQQTTIKVTLYRSGNVIKSNYNANEEKLEKADILITNIDSLLNRYIKNDMSQYLFNLYASNIIFDEYHDFFCDKPLFANFIRLLWAKTLYTNSKTLFLSATPLKFDCFYDNETKNIIKYYDHSNIPIYNGDMIMNIHYSEYNDINDFKIQNKDAFVITNTVKQSQMVFNNICDDNTMLLHSRFTDFDRKNKEDAIYMTHDKFSNINKRNLVIGTNIIGVGLDISANHIYDFVISPESTIQRGCGRGGRFNEKEYNNEINYDVCTLKKIKWQ